MFEEAAQIMYTGSFGLRAVLTMLGAGTAAFGIASAIPSVQNRMLPPAAVDELWTFLPFRAVAPDRRTVICADDRYLQVLELKGAEINLAAANERDKLFDVRKYFVDELEKLDVDHVKLFSIKQQIQLERELRSNVPLIRTIDEKWESEFPTAYRLVHYVVLVVRGKDYLDGEAKLAKAMAFAASTLADFRPSVMEEPEDPEALAGLGRGDLPRGPLHPFAQVLSPITRQSPYGMRFTGPLSSLLTSDEVDFSRTDDGYMVFKNREQRKYAAVMAMRHCGEKTSEDIMRDVLALDCEMVVYHAIKPIEQSRANMDLQRGKLASLTAHLSRNAEAEYEKVIGKVEGMNADARSSLCHYAVSIVPLCPSINGRNGLLEIQSKVMSILTRTAGTGITLANTAQPTWLSMTNMDDTWPRRFRFLSENIACSFYPQRSAAGMVKSDWAPEPLAWFRTASGDPYPFNLHATDTPKAPAHACVIGPTGSGKTTFLTFLAASACRVPKLRVFLMDRLQGMQIFTTCTGGSYVNFDGDERNASLNPFHLADSPDNRAFLRQWLANVLDAGDRRDAVLTTEIARAVTMNYDTGQPKSLRSMRAMARFAFQPTGMARKNVQPWIDPDSYGGYFNAEEDSLDLEASRIVAFNMTRALNDARLAPVMVDYLVHRMQDLSRTTGDPSLVIVDESAPMLRSESFANRFIEVGLQEGRKLRQAYVLCFQTPQALHDTGKGEVIIANCNTLLFLRNPVDSEATADQYRRFGLNDAEIDFVLGRTFKNLRYAMLVKRQAAGESSIIDFGLGGLGNYLRVFQSGVEEQLALRALLDKYPTDEAVQRYIHRPRT